MIRCTLYHNAVALQGHVCDYGHARFLACILFLILIPHAHQARPSGSGVTLFEDPPAWAQEVIWYQIFVERFRNGDPSNDPTAEDMEGAYPGFVPDGWQVTPWGHDWYAPDPWFSELEGMTDLSGNPLTSFGQKAQLRRYGGDLQGVLDQIDYLDSLGITAVYFNPLNDAPSLHKYDARHWRHIDRNFGPAPQKDARMMADEVPGEPSTWQWTEADKMFLRIIDLFHQRGIKVILDYSWNHTGVTFWAWKDLVRNQRASKYKDWYWVQHFDDPSTEENEFAYRGWLGVPSLPEIRETVYHDHAEGITPFEGDIFSAQVKQHIFAVTHRWLDPNKDGDPSDGVDGFRLDVAAELPFGFWRDYRKMVRAINPDAYLLGEVWWEQWPDKLLDPEPFLRGDIFDAVMNYRWYRAARHFFNSSPDPMSVPEFVQKLEALRKDLKPDVNAAMMNLNASHDAPRVLTSLFNKNKYKYNSSPSADPGYRIHKPGADTEHTLKMLLAHQYTWIGAPHIWAGDEMGMWGADDPSTRKPLIWPDMTFEEERVHPSGKNRPVDTVTFNHDLFDVYTQLIHIRKTHPVLVSGEVTFFSMLDNPGILAYSRSDAQKEVITIINTNNESNNIDFPIKFNQLYVPLFGEADITLNSARCTMEVPPRSAVILSN